MNINSYMPVKIVSGKNCFNENCEILKKFGDRCLIVTGGTSAKKSGALDDAEKALKKLGILYDIFDEITQNPYTADCHRAGEAARKIRADFILGIGGGSPLDASKAAAVYAANSKLSASDIYLRKYNNNPLPVVLIGTTAGTGSEVTGVAVLTNSDNNMKKSISGDDCYAAVSFCDYSYTLSVPFDVTVSTALDALSHAVESYFSSKANDISDIYAEKAFKIISRPLKSLTESNKLSKILPNEETREMLYEASLFAGLALNITGTCFPHTVGYVLTDDFGVAHGRACASFLPEFIEVADTHMREKASVMFGLLGTDKAELCALITELADVNISITEEQLEKYKNRWTSPVKNFIRTPGSFTSDNAVEMLGKFVNRKICK